MKYVLRFALTAFSFVCISSYADDQNAVADFKAIARQIEAAFAPSPILYDMQNFDDSPTGKIVIPTRYSALEATFDVKKTDSLVTPLMAKAIVKIVKETTLKCGSFKSRYGGPRAISPEEAQRVVEMPACWGRDSPLFQCSIIATYGFSDGKWELRSFTSQPIGCWRIITYALGTPIGGRLPTDLNAKWSEWKALITGLIAAASDPLP